MIQNSEIANFADVLRQGGKKYVVLDADETIFHLVLPWQWYTEKLQELIKDVDPGIVEKHGTDIALLENTATQEYGASIKNKINRLANQFESEKLQEIQPNPEMVNFISQNHTKYTFSIWSSNCKASIENALEFCGLKPKMFSCICAKDTMDYIKQDAQGFADFIYQPGASLNEYIMAGDKMHRDRLAAQTVGIDFFLVEYFKKK